MYWKKLEVSSLHIDFGLILTNLPCSDAEALLIPCGFLILIHRVLGCQDHTSFLDKFEVILNPSHSTLSTYEYITLAPQHI